MRTIPGSIVLKGSLRFVRVLWKVRAMGVQRIASAAPRFLLAVPLLALLGAGDPLPVDPVRHTTCLRYYSLEGDVKPDLVRRAVAELSTIEVEAKLALGPLGVSSKPKYRFVALELPVGTSAKDVEKALHKATPKVVELAWTGFQGK